MDRLELGSIQAQVRELSSKRQVLTLRLPQQVLELLRLPELELEPLLRSKLVQGLGSKQEQELGSKLARVLGSKRVQVGNVYELELLYIHEPAVDA
jgi:hypothetical protein